MQLTTDRGASELERILRVLSLLFDNGYLLLKRRHCEGSRNRCHDECEQGRSDSEGVLGVRRRGIAVVAREAREGRGRVMDWRRRS